MQIMQWKNLQITSTRNQKIHVVFQFTEMQSLVYFFVSELASPKDPNLEIDKSINH